jgi:hypothetical protein
VTSRQRRHDRRSGAQTPGAAEWLGRPEHQQQADRHREGDEQRDGVAPQQQRFGATE